MKNKSVKQRQNYKKQINKELLDYENSINDTYIAHLYDMLYDIYDCTGWSPTTLNEYIGCANYENNMRNNPIWYIPNIEYFRPYLHIKLL